jgi:hypothetical protein
MLRLRRRRPTASSRERVVPLAEDGGAARGQGGGEAGARAVRATGSTSGGVVAGRHARDGEGGEGSGAAEAGQGVAMEPLPSLPALVSPQRQALSPRAPAEPPSLLVSAPASVTAAAAASVTAAAAVVGGGAAAADAANGPPAGLGATTLAVAATLYGRTRHERVRDPHGSRAASRAVLLLSSEASLDPGAASQPFLSAASSAAALSALADASAPTPSALLSPSQASLHFAAAAAAAIGGAETPVSAASGSGAPSPAPRVPRGSAVHWAPSTAGATVPALSHKTLLALRGHSPSGPGKASVPPHGRRSASGNLQAGAAGSLAGVPGAAAGGSRRGTGGGEAFMRLLSSLAEHAQVRRGRGGGWGGRGPVGAQAGRGARRCPVGV